MVPVGHQIIQPGNLFLGSGVTREIINFIRIILQIDIAG